MRIFHIALESDWREARRTGEYTTSTLGRSLAEEGFIHASREDQVRRVHDAFYASVHKPLVRLEIDTDKLKPEWREDPVSSDTYPHIYGPLNVDAVIAVRPWHRSGRDKSVLEVYLNEALVRVLLAVLAMLLAFLGAWVGRGFGDDWAPFVGALVGLGAGGVLYSLTLRRRRNR